MLLTGYFKYEGLFIYFLYLCNHVFISIKGKQPIKTLGMENCNIVALFDLDGVILDTETDYTVFWDNIGLKYLGLEDFCRRIKGQTLVHIFDEWFTKNSDRQRITAELDEFENSMPYDFVPGAEEFLHSLKSAAIPMAVVTSSNARKMEVVFNRRPQLRALFDHVLMSEDFTESKPSPQCFIRGMEKFGARPSKTIVFEDSVSGLQAGKASGATLVGLTTTNPASVVSQYADYVIPDFVGRSLSDFPLVK